ncbi:MAG: CPCC family cysteine-rich protein [Bacilli bacterium]|nr:CPCC family cysteine-rich protein [Bacilli bacterium]
MVTGTKGYSNLYGNSNHMPDRHINYPYALSFNQSTLAKHTESHHTLLSIESNDYNGYKEKAIAFANKVDSIFNDSFVDTKGTTYKYSYETKEFVIVKSDGTIISYYIPRSRDKDQYWENVKRRIKGGKKGIMKKNEMSVEEVEKMKCPVCGEYTFNGLYDICPVCGWENDIVQLDNPDDGGANAMSLNQRIEWFKGKRAKKPNYHWEKSGYIED